MARKSRTHTYPASFGATTVLGIGVASALFRWE